MIRLHPVPDARYSCPRCDTALETLGWYVPGMRTLADLGCPSCARRYYGDLPSGFGLFYPQLLDRESGEVHDPYGASWFATWLADSYARRTSEEIPVEVEALRPVERPLLLDCLDGVYGHALLKLLNAQHHLDRQPELDLLVLVPRFLRWLVPDGVAEIWTLDLPLRRGSEWSDALAGRLHARLDGFAEAQLSLTVPHPRPQDVDITRFTRVPHGARGSANGLTRVTFVAREDRLWEPSRRLLGRRRSQASAIVELHRGLRNALGAVDLAVVGVGRPGGLPDTIEDLRVPAPGDEDERRWCRRYADSDAVFGVHGSNMLLPSAYGGLTVELVPRRFGSLVQSLLVAPDDPRRTLLRYRFLPLDTEPGTAADEIAAALRERPLIDLSFADYTLGHDELARDPSILARRRLELLARRGGRLRAD